MVITVEFNCVDKLFSSDADSCLFLHNLSHTSIPVKTLGDMDQPDPSRQYRNPCSLRSFAILLAIKFVRARISHSPVVMSTSRISRCQTTVPVLSVGDHTFFCLISICFTRESAKLYTAVGSLYDLSNTILFSDERRKSLTSTPIHE